MKHQTGIINWNEQFKIRVRRNASAKHEVIKTLLVRNLIEKYKSNLYWTRIYTEYPIGNGKICDVYFENVLKKEIICYEIQKTISDDWLKKTKESYDKFTTPFFKNDWMLIKEKELPDDIIELDKKIGELIA
jgi:hypothetical protein